MLIIFALCVALCLWAGASKLGLWFSLSLALVFGSGFAAELHSIASPWLLFGLPFAAALLGWSFLGGRGRSAARKVRNAAAYRAAYRGKSDV